LRNDKPAVEPQLDRDRVVNALGLPVFTRWLDSRRSSHLGLGPDALVGRSLLSCLFDLNDAGALLDSHPCPNFVDLAGRLRPIGIDDTPKNLSNKIARGGPPKRRPVSRWR
jgi:hypothetical protein